MLVQAYWLMLMHTDWAVGTFGEESVEWRAEPALPTWRLLVLKVFHRYVGILH